MVVVFIKMKQEDLLLQTDGVAVKMLLFAAQLQEHVVQQVHYKSK